MDTREFLKRYAWVYLYVVAFFLGAAAVLLHSVETVGSMQPFSASPVIVIDAGHGAPDGGATGVSGTREDAINLAIARRLEALLTLLGRETVMTRTGEGCIATEGETIRAKKQSDLRNRVERINALPAALVVSIHQNSYTSPSCKGAQVFYYEGSETGKALAERLQDVIKETLADGNTREAKANSSYYMLKKSAYTSVIVECGFLSNPEEEALLLSEEYQEKMAWAIHLGILQYLNAE